MAVIYDITRTIAPNLAVWPGDTPFSAEVVQDMQRGDPINLTTITLSSHTGTHADAPLHFTPNGRPVDGVSLAAYIGPATVVSVRRTAGPLVPADFPNLAWAGTERLLVHSGASHLPDDQFADSIIYPSPELAAFMAGYGLVLFGSDAPSMDAIDSKTLPGHNALQQHGIAILEGLQLAEVPDGHYELIALPLKIAGGDGSPVRAILLAV